MLLKSVISIKLYEVCCSSWSSTSLSHVGILTFLGKAISKPKAVTGWEESLWISTLKPQNPEDNRNSLFQFWITQFWMQTCNFEGLACDFVQQFAVRSNTEPVLIECDISCLLHVLFPAFPLVVKFQCHLLYLHMNISLKSKLYLWTDSSFIFL